MLTLAQTLWYSSNIGVSRIIDDHYRNNPEKFVKGIYRTGLHDDLKIPLAEQHQPESACRTETRTDNMTTGQRPVCHG